MSRVDEIDPRIRNMAVLHPDLSPSPAAIADFHNRYTATRKKIGLDGLGAGTTIDCVQVDGFLGKIESGRDFRYKYSTVLNLTLA